MSEVRDISVDYRDKSIDKNLRWDDTPLHETNNVDVGKSLAKFADVLQDLKKEVDRNETFTLLEIFRWVYEKHNFSLDEIPAVLHRYRQNLRRYPNRDKFSLHKKRTNAKSRTEVLAISLSDWEHNRNIIIRDCEGASKSIQKALTSLRYKRYTKIGSWFYCFDYFFNNLKEYKADKLFFELEWKNNIKILNTCPNEDEPLYILHRITKNAHAWMNVVNWLNDIDRYKKRRKYFRQETIINTKFTQDTKYLTKTIFGVKTYNITNLYMYSERQIKALVWLRDNFRKKYPYLYLYKKETEVSVFFDNLRDFLKNKQRYIERYDCLFEQGKTYRSLWL